MSDPASQIKTAIEAIRRAAEADLAITQSAVREIERQVGVIRALTQNPEVEREGAYLVARALGRYTDRASKPSIILDARLQGAIGRFEYVLRQLGFLPATTEGDRSEKEPGPPAGPAG